PIRAAGAGGVAGAALRLELKGPRLGALALSFDRKRPFGRADRTFLRAIAQQAAQALERARLYQAEQEARTRAEALSTRLLHLEAISQAGLSHLDLQALL